MANERYQNQMTPIENILQKDRPLWGRWVAEHTAMYEIMGSINIKGRWARKSNRDIVSFHKHMFGLQTYCFDGNRRYWVWEMPPFAIVYVANGRGCGFGVKKNLTPEQAYQEWSRYLDGLNIGERVRKAVEGG